MILRRLKNENVIPVVILEPKDFDSKHFAFDLLKRAGRCSVSGTICGRFPCGVRQVESSRPVNEGKGAVRVHSLNWVAFSLGGGTGCQWLMFVYVCHLCWLSRKLR